MILTLGNGKYIAVAYIAEIKIKGNEPCKIWIKTLDERWHFWRQSENHEKAIDIITDVLGRFIA